MLVSGYGDLLRTRGVARIISAQLLARFPSGMISLAFLLHIEEVLGSYGAAGLVLAATSVGQGVSGPLLSRWMNLWAMRPVLVLTSLVCGSAMVAIALAQLPLWGYMVLGLVCGLSIPPVQSSVRTIYPKMVTARQLTPLFSLDASAQEIIWVAGPVLTTFVSIQISTSLGILVAAVFLIGGGAWFIASPEVGSVRIPRSKRRFGAVLKRPPVLLATVVGFLLVGSFAAVEAAVVATFGEGGVESGLVLAIFAVASLVGGLALGGVAIKPRSLALRSLFIFVGVALAALWLDFWWLSATLVIAGFGIAPALAVMSAMVATSVRFSDTAEAYGWSGTGQLLGAAAGSAAAGFMIDGFGAVGGFWIGAGLALLGVVVATVFRSGVPDLRGRDATSIPDTAPVPVQPS